jgi:predicted alpha-1,6-mannanase (GH76 family)
MRPQLLALTTIVFGSTFACAGTTSEVSETSDLALSAPAQASANADDAVEAMLLAFWSQKNENLFATRGATALTNYWNYQQAWDVVLDAVERHHGARFNGTLRTFYNAQNAIGWSRNWYDDENWSTLALIRAYDLTADATYLDEARTLYADIMGAWDTTCCGATEGGLWWDRAHTQKATASNAGAVLSGARLYERTKDAAYLAFAQKAFAFWAANMVDPTTHQVYDHMTVAGEKVAWKFTYNEGLMIGAAVALAQASGDTSSIALAEQIASFMLAHETESSAVGLILTDGSDTACQNDCIQFKGIAARYLTTLYQAVPAHTEYLSLLTQSADAAWTLARDPSSRLYGTDWGEPFSPPAQLKATSSAAMAIAASATLLGSAPSDPAGVYEAEESVLHSVGLEATYGAFDGWGYVAGWGDDGQWVDFLVTAPSAGSYDLTFRYAASKAASRLVHVNGTNVIANQKFASTGSWDTYATVTAKVPLVAGQNTVSLIYNSSLGSSNYVNLDRLTVTGR